MNFTSFNSTSYEFSYSENSRSVAGLALIFLSAIYITRTLSERRKGKLPPGPKGLPIVGNLFQLSLDAWIPFTEWKYKFGSLVYLTAGSQGILVINSHKVATELLDRKANIYNSRPRFIVASEYLTGGMFLGLVQNNDIWKRMRRAGNEVLNKTMAPSFYPAQEEEAVRLVYNMLQTPTPKLWDSELQRAASSLILSMVYNLPILKSSDDPAIERINQFVSRLTQAIYPGTYLVEYFPWMRHLPAFVSKWKRDAQMWYRRDTEFFRELYTGVKDRMEKGDDRGSFTSHVIHDQERYELSETEISWLSANMYSGGAETSATAVSWFMLAMIAYPEVQEKCQEELDTVVGRFRMPRFTDQDDLPYIRATARELLRWRTVVPIGGLSSLHRDLLAISDNKFRSSTSVDRGAQLPPLIANPRLGSTKTDLRQDDWYGGYFIPKNTIVISNIWAMNRDKDVYGPDADVFRPERHLGPDGKLAPSPPDTKRKSGSPKSPASSAERLFVYPEGNVSFGYGGRICPGRHVANSSLFINIASILWAANITPEKDAQGKYVAPNISDTATVNDGIVV
ncbi:hypothetical protein V5O48_002808 [Marasmius crinis-equi]|uniref:Cytochrome P450 n=1 Tax=Marasmius crinis-equi TaxID=585013 RepID=A0ABR3FVD4_9AGAR